jgi:uncharacterized membrane protein YdbT with pleckstrin-like domain
MSYINKVLLPGERVIFETGLHWLVYGRAILLLGLALILAAASQLEAFYGPNSTFLLLIAAAVLGILGIVALLHGMLRRAGTELAVTDQRVVLKHGLFGRHTIEMNRSKVESVDVDQGIIGRIFGYGTVLVRGTGGSTEPLEGISDPLGFRSHITTDPVARQA